LVEKVIKGRERGVVGEISLVHEVVAWVVGADSQEDEDNVVLILEHLGGLVGLVDLRSFLSTLNVGRVPVGGQHNYAVASRAVILRGEDVLADEVQSTGGVGGAMKIHRLKRVQKSIGRLGAGVRYAEVVSDGCETGRDAISNQLPRVLYVAHPGCLGTKLGRLDEVGDEVVQSVGFQTNKAW